jgi:hypothetical protein
MTFVAYIAVGISNHKKFDCRNNFPVCKTWSVQEDKRNCNATLTIDLNG